MDHHVFLFSFVSFLILVVRSDFDRNVTVSLNPGYAGEPASDVPVNLVHVTGVGPEDAVSVVWTTVGAPAALIAKTAVDAKLTVNWTELLRNQSSSSASSPITFSSPPHSVYGVVLRNLVEYDDVDDVADPEYYVKKKKTIDVKRIPLDGLVWENVTMGDGSFKMVSSKESPVKDALVIEIRFSGSSSRSTALPHLQLTPNNTLCDVALVNATTHFKHSRFYLELLVVDATEGWDFGRVSTIDDEYTPGVFTSYSLVSKKALKSDEAYVEWKPVAYLSAKRNLDSITIAKAFNATKDSVGDVKSILADYFGVDKNKTKAKSVKLGFGNSKDKFYVHTNYTVWSFVAGFGSAPEDAVSTLVIIVISFGLGIPLIFLVAGGIYAGLKDVRKRKEDEGDRAGKPLIEENQGGADYGAINSVNT